MRKQRMRALLLKLEDYRTQPLTVLFAGVGGTIIEAERLGLSGVAQALYSGALEEAIIFLKRDMAQEGCWGC